MTASDLYPTSLRLLGRPVLVVGGGRVAGRRVGALLDAGALVTVVAPKPGEEVERLAAGNRDAAQALNHSAGEMVQANDNLARDSEQLLTAMKAG